MKQMILCIDMESVLTPEIWQEIAKISNVEELMLTTRDISDSDELMNHRLKYLEKTNLTYSKIQEIASKIELLPGALEFLNWAREHMQVIILSDSFIELAKPLLQKMGNPTIFTHSLVIENDKIVGYNHRIDDQKTEAVKRFKELNFKTFATGDSFNDIGMINEADFGCFFKPGKKVLEAYPETGYVNSFAELKEKIQEVL